MLRSLLAGALSVALIAVAALPDSAAQEKKQPPRKKERIAVAEPTDAAKDPDFAIQGEYEGSVDIDGMETKLGAQVIAKGRGEFAIKAYKDGLPGAGWDGMRTKEVEATRVEGKVVVKSNGKEIGTIENGTMTVKPTDEAITFKKVERKSKTLGAKPPEGAVVLFAKEGDEANWTNGKLVALSDGKFLNVGVKSKEKFGAFKAHIEFRLPWMPNSTGQGRGNSGVYLQDRYELQVLDSFGLSGENNECGGIYTQHKPKVNMCLPPLAWQTYDIEFTPAQFEGDKKIKNSRATIHHNGVLIHDNVELPKECPGGQKETDTPGPFQFQNHGDPVVYRNVWVLPVK
jgi:sporulation protein YlmC with PRC-barrel domain